MPTQPQDTTPADPQGLRLLTVADASRALGLTERAIRHLIATHSIPVVRIQRNIRLRPADLSAWIAANTTPARPEHTR